MVKNFVCSQKSPIVKTKAGDLRGMYVDGTYMFFGVKYAEAKRFHMPMPVKPWEGVKEATSYGYVCPLLNQDAPSAEVLVPHRYWPMDEDCLNLNVWTQSISRTAKKPVMVWLHGGGFYAGSSIEQVSYDGENMSKYGDVVVVSLNHRLNILGYFNLEAYGDEYANSGNAGNADMVEALRWIRDNIEAFGGNPDNVTLFGQSGGGMKVWTLMQTPEADGLFHKGIIQSGLIEGFIDVPKTDGTILAESLLQALGLASGDIQSLETVPYYYLAEAYKKVSPKLAEAGEYIGGVPIANDFYVGNPRFVGFREHAKTIPLIIGTVFGEFFFGPGIQDKQLLSEAEAVNIIKSKFGDNSEELIRLFKAAYPEKCLVDLVFLDSIFRAPTMDFIAKRSKCLQAPVYAYMFDFEFPYDDGKPAWHCSEIPFVFKNTDKVPVCHVPGVTDALEDAMFYAWMAFAKTGNPNCSQLPNWPPCKPEDEAVMMFDKVRQVRHNYDHALIQALLKAEAAMPKSDEEDTRIIH